MKPGGIETKLAESAVQLMALVREMAVASHPENERIDWHAVGLIRKLYTLQHEVSLLE